MYLLSKEKTIAPMNPSQFSITTARSHKAQSALNSERLFSSPEQGQTIQSRTIGRVGTCMQQVASHHLINNFPFAVHPFCEESEIRIFQIKAGRYFHRQWNALGHVQDVGCIFLSDRGQWR